MLWDQFSQLSPQSGGIQCLTGNKVHYVQGIFLVAFQINIMVGIIYCIFLVKIPIIFLGVLKLCLIPYSRINFGGLHLKCARLEPPESNFSLSSEYQDICSHPALCCLSFYQLHWQGFPDVICKGVSWSWDLRLISNGYMLRFFPFPSLLLGVSISSKPCIALLILAQKCFSSGDSEENLFPTEASLTPHPRDPFLRLFLSLNITNIFTFYSLSKSQGLRWFIAVPAF